MLGGGEHFEFKSHGMADEGTIGGDDWHLTQIAREANVYMLDFASGKLRYRARVSVSPILDRHITVDWRAMIQPFQVRAELNRRGMLLRHNVVADMMEGNPMITEESGSDRISAS
jgi:hypothetical protein